MAAEAIWFGAEHPYLFGWVHTPASDGRAPAVVLCPGLGRDGANAHYTYRRLATELAQSGLTAIRFDYEGTGDSVGNGLGNDRVEAWLASIEAAVTLARDAGATSVSLVGLRMGALLAEHAAERITGLEALVLWDPSVSGRAFVRSQRALELFREGSDGSPTKHYGIPWLAMSADGLEELRNVTAPEEIRRAPTPTLLVHRPNDANADSVRARLGEQPVEAVEVEGQYELLDVDPAYNVVPEQTITMIVNWLHTTLTSAGASAPTPRAPRAAGAEPVISADHAFTQPDSPFGSVKETAVRLGPAGLFGIETAPQRQNPALPTIVFLNGGRIWHVSPGRLWVRMARSLAALGFRCVRFDLSGLGDSPTRPGQVAQLSAGPEALQDIEEAARAISPDDIGNIVLVGLSSGGYHALEMGLRLKPRAVCAVNPIVSFTPPELASGRIDPRRRVCIPKSKLTTNAAKRIKLAPLHRLLVRIAWLIRRIRYRKRSQTIWLREFVRSGVSVYGICAPPEAIEMLGDAGPAPPELTATGLLRVDVIEGLHHALVPQDHQELVSERLTAYLREQFLADHDSAPLVMTNGAEDDSTG